MQPKTGAHEEVLTPAFDQLTPFKIYMTVFLAAKIGLLFFLAYNSRFVMDEFHQGGMSFFIDKGFYKSVLPVKTILYAYFYQLAHMLGDDSFQIMLIAREQTALLGCATIFCLYFVARNIGRKHLEAIFILCVTLAFSTFVERIFRVRSEPLALCFAMLSLWVVTCDRQTAAKLIVAGLLTGASFLTTQKAIYFNIALGVALVVNGLMTGSVKTAVKSGLLLLAGWFAALLLYSLYFRGIYFYEVIHHILSRPANLAVHGGEYYENLAVFTKNTLIRNLPFYLLGTAGWFQVAYGVRYMKRQEQIGWIFSGVITFFVFTHNQPWPYVFIWCIPFIALWSDRPLAFIGGRYGRRFMAVALAVIAVFSFVRNVKYVGHSNLLQRQVVTQAQSLLNPQDAYCDGMGMVVNRPQVMRSWWDKRKLMKILQDAKTGESREIEEIFLKQPKVWLLSYRTDELENVLNPYFAGSYIRIFPNVLVSGARVSGSGETMFMNSWKGEYRLFSPKGRPLDDSYSLNGRTVSGVVKVPLGRSLLRLNGRTSSAYLLPADILAPFEISTDMKQMPLFEYVYTY